MAAHTDIGNMLLRAARAAPRLDVDEERALVARYRNDDRAALGQLIIANVRLAIGRAGRLRSYGLPEEDLIQEGIVGLLEAASRFDINRGLRFSTYAMWWIKATTMEFVLRNWSIVRVAMSGEQKNLFFNLRKIKTRLLRDPSANPASIRAAIAAAMGVQENEIDLMEARLAGDVALNASAPWDEEGELELGDCLIDAAPLPDAFAARLIDDDDQEHSLRLAMAKLDDQERLVVQERWLTEDIAPLEMLGEFFGVSATRVKRIEIGAIAKLQMTMARHQAALIAA